MALSWLTAGALLSGLISLWFIRYLWPYRNRLGGRFFIATIACEALWALSYGIALMVFDPAVREWFEVPIWLAINFIGVCFLAFALEYTGRGRLLRSRWMAGVVGLQVVHTLVVVTNHWHGIAWASYEVVPAFGAATVVYPHQPWLFVNAAGFILLIGVASFLLADTVFSYGRLYRSQAAAIAVSPIFPGVPFLVWLAGVPGSPPLNLTPLLFPVHLAFDMYAFFSRSMFDMVPAARRVADRNALDNLGTGVVIIDTEARIIELNREAERLLDAPKADAVGDWLDDHLPGLDPDDPAQDLSLSVAGRRREFVATTAPLRDSGGSVLGSTIVLQDVTADRQREQRLNVLNRVLRHNLRNDLNVVKGFIDIARSESDDPAITDHLDTAAEKTETLLDLGETARLIEQALDATDVTQPVAVHGILEDMAAEHRGEHEHATIEVDVPEDLELAGNVPLVRGVFDQLVENALEHTNAEHPRVTVRYRGRDEDTEHAIIAVADNGPGIPEMELDILGADEETPLEHGSGLGLWFVTWGVGSLGGTMDFETSAEGTTCELRLPIAES